MRTMYFLLLLAVTLTQAPALPPDKSLETTHLSVSDGTGRLSAEQLKRLAGQAQETLDRVLAFWSADAGLERFGKIRVIFDAPRRDFYSCVFYWDQEAGRRIRVVRVHGTEGTPQMMAHKLTSAVFPQKDKLIRNLMGILAEAQVGNPLTFPACGCCRDDWVRAILELKSYLPLAHLGPDHESWGMSDAGGGRLQVHDKYRQHRAYAETGSFASYLFQTYGVQKIKRLQKLSQEKERPWQEVFGASLTQLEAAWLKALPESGQANATTVSLLQELLQENPDTACAKAQKQAATKQ